MRVTAQERTLAAVGRAAGSRAPREEIAQDLLVNLREVIGYDAIQVSLCDPFTESHRVLVNDGYSKEILDYIDGDYFERDRGFQQIFCERRPLRMQDVSFAYKESHTFLKYWQPAGFNEGLTSALFTEDDRYIGMVNMSVCNERAITEGIREFVGILSPVLASALDPLNDVSGALLSTGGAGCRMIIAANGAVLEYSDPVRSEQSIPNLDEQIVAAIAQAMLRAEQPVRRGLIADRDGQLVSLYLVRVIAPRLSSTPVALVGFAPAALPFGITRRETEVLRHLIAGSSNREIGNALKIAPRTVATHLEHMLKKFNAETRTAVAGRAFEHGLVRLDIAVDR